MVLRATLRRKLLLAFGLVAGIMAMVAVFLLSRLAAVNDTYANHAIHWQEAGANAMGAGMHVNRQVASLRGYLLVGNAEMFTEYQEGQKVTKQKIADLLRGVDDPQILTDIKTLEELNTAFAAPAEHVLALAMDGRRLEAQEAFTAKSYPIATQMIALVSQLTVQLQQKADEAVGNAGAAAAAARMWGQIALAAGMAVAIVVAWGLAVAITKPVQRVANLARGLAAGNLRVEKLRITSNDEIGDMARAFDHMVEALQNVIRGVHE
ncbi:MAG TPA: HAMP domain-containing protein, partial [Symbiobacteriaceae bacterium]|nr:HAMP domain-containing protein [Symbiobacteriaceae bacterium]